MVISIQTFESSTEFILFLIIFVTTLLFIANSIANYEKFTLYGKILFYISCIPLLLLVVYLTQYGYWTDEIPRISDSFVQKDIGNGSENLFFISSCLLNILAYCNKKVIK